MSLELKIDVEGADQIASRLTEIADSLSSQIGQALREVGEMIVNEAQANAPVDTGYLRDHIQIQEDSDTSVTVVSEAEYSAFVEYGTRYMDAQPFFEPAVQNARADIEARLRDIISGNL